MPATCAPPAAPTVAAALAGIVLEPGDQIAHVARRKILPRDDQLGRVCKERNRLEIVHHVVGERVGHRIDHVRAPLPDDERVAVGRRAGHTANPDVAAGARDILDDHGLAERRPQRLGQNARKHVRGAARRERRDYGDGASGVDLCRRAADTAQARSERKRRKQRFHLNSAGSAFLPLGGRMRERDRPPRAEACGPASNRSTPPCGRDRRRNIFRIAAAAARTVSR